MGRRAAIAEWTSAGSHKVRFRPRTSGRAAAPPVPLVTRLEHNGDDGPSLADAVRSRRPSRYERSVKPVVDRCAGTLALIVTMPIMLVVAAIVLIRLGRPILYVQPRVGKDGATFRMLKFRTMRTDRRGQRDPSEYDGLERRKTHKSSADPRHTKLDELPQLVHVIAGHMSLVGPRPELPAVVAAKYEPWQHTRHVVRPGITGLWQTTTADCDGSMWRDTAIDLQYIVALSFRADLRILMRTFFRSRPTQQAVPEAPDEVTVSAPLTHPSLMPSTSERQAITR
jgi:lipopolysaccharide/colanic/teichoic acid biosynthesis glycosyltransferase